MDAIQQQMLDTYRATRLGEVPPPLPGRHDWEAVRDARDHLRRGAAPARRPGGGKLRRAVNRLLGRRGAPG
ncbi:hypothetical protein ACPXCE_26475 [Streptomyces sp. DT24]|uniref:hypothetical protein n=1 Tax=unclassified Streptomyces TaxID=2593676 RepID=UPI0023B9BEE2|nr:hypothetical protein [Streptomyces sp. AM 4-1-1]WEH34141.1 hypothetical protein PZB75_12670 [Streptomyces sp. AM 4-1-1]